MSEDLSEIILNLQRVGDPSKSCLLCGKSPGELTSEHVIPQWAQRRHDLFGQRLQLLNRSEIPYRYLTVPCCVECNRERLKPIEDAMASAVDEGRHAVEKLGLNIPFLWLSKMLYGLLYKQTMLMHDRAQASSGTILDAEFVRRYHSLRFFMQQAGDLIKPIGFSPGSIFVFQMQSLPQRRLEWDLRDCVEPPFVGCRVGKVGLIGVLADGGAQRGFARDYRTLDSLELHPLQFRELCAQFYYRSTLFKRVPKYVTIESNPHHTFQMPLGGFTRAPLFDKWVPRDYADILSQFTGIDLELIFKPPDAVWTWLYDSSGNPNHMSYSSMPW